MSPKATHPVEFTVAKLEYCIRLTLNATQPGTQPPTTMPHYAQWVLLHGLKGNQKDAALFFWGGKVPYFDTDPIEVFLGAEDLEVSWISSEARMIKIPL